MIRHTDKQKVIQIPTYTGLQTHTNTRTQSGIHRVTEETTMQMLQANTHLYIHPATYIPTYTYRHTLVEIPNHTVSHYFLFRGLVAWSRD